MSCRAASALSEIDMACELRACARRNNASEKCIRLLRRGALAHRLRHLRQKRQVRFKSSYHPLVVPLASFPLFLVLLFSRSRHLPHARFRALERASPAGGTNRRNASFHLTQLISENSFDRKSEGHTRGVLLRRTVRAEFAGWPAGRPRFLRGEVLNF
jgi:hypothetical protein